MSALSAPERRRLQPPSGGFYITIASKVLGEVFEGILVNISLANPAGTPVTLTMSNDGEVPEIHEQSRIEVHFAADDARILPRAETAHG